MSPLTTHLATLSPKEHDAYLAEIWRSFNGSDAHAALTYLIDVLLQEAEGPLMSPSTAPHARSFAAGQAASLRRLKLSIGANISIDLSQADYAGATAGPDDDDIPADEDQLI